MADGNSLNFGDIEQQYGLPSGVLNGLYMAESSGGRDLGPSSAGAFGPFQLMPDTIAQYKPDMGNVRSQADAAARRLRDALKQHGGDLDAALATYGGFITKNPSGYVRKVRSYMTDNSSAPSTDLDTLVRQATSSADTSSLTGDVQRLEELRKKKEAAEAPVIEQEQKTISRDVTDAQKKFEGIEPFDVKPWSQQVQPRSSMELFGSVGSVFAIMASAFTHTPMINALNGSAAAMNAIKQQDRQAYEDAFETWKTNYKLALDRHRLMQEDYDLANEKMRTDMEAGETMRKLASLKYGDETALVMQESGLHEKIATLQDSRRSAYQQLVQLYPSLLKTGEQQKSMLQWHEEFVQKNGREPNSQETLQARQRVEQAWSPYGGRLTPTGSLEAQYQQGHDQFVADNGREPTFEESLALRKQIADANKAATGGGGGIGGLRAEAARKGIAEQEKKLGRPLNAQEELDQVNKTIPMTGNQREKMQGQAEQFTYSINKIDEVLTTLDKHVLSAGIAGRATRLAERVGNIFGSNNTDRVQMMRDIEYLRMEGTRLMTAAQGRPLSGEATRINDIIAGINLGDTTANTIRSLQEVRDLYTKMQDDLVGRLGGGGNLDLSNSAGGGGGKAKTDTPWMNDPVQQ